MSDHLLRELRIAKECICPRFQAGKLACFVEPSRSALNQFFILRVYGDDWVGRKVLQKTESGVWRISSILDPSMLLGRLHQMSFGDGGVFFYYLWSSAAEKKEIFEQALSHRASHLVFPFPAYGTDSGEKVAAPALWNCNEALAQKLNADELHFRQYSAALLRPILKSGAVIYDPACSTGEFIAYLADAIPGCKCIGSDLSRSMIAYAKVHHRSASVQFHVCDAEQAALGRSMCDVLILRFLNAEVVTRDKAEMLFRSLVSTLKPNGMAIVFGHTPVLLAAQYLAQQTGLTLLSCLAGRPGKTELFQFYVLKRVGR